MSEENFNKLADLCEKLKISEDLTDLITYMSTFSKEEQDSYTLLLKFFIREPFDKQIVLLRKALAFE